MDKTYINPRNISKEQYVSQLAQESDLYDSTLAEKGEFGLNYQQMLAGLVQNNVDTSAFDKSMYQFLSDDNKINYIWNTFYNEDQNDKILKNMQFLELAEFEKKRQVYEGLNGFEKTLGNVFGVLTAMGEGILGIPEGLYTTFEGLRWTITGDETARKHTEEGLGYMNWSRQGAQYFYDAYTAFNDSEVLSTVKEVAENIGRMAPNIAATILTGGLASAGWIAQGGAIAKAIGAAGTALYYATMPGDTIREILNDPNYKVSNEFIAGADEVGRGQILAYTAGAMATEIISESAFAGKFIKFGVVDPDKVAVKLVSKKWAQNLVSWGLDAVGEGLEEVFAEIVEPMLKTAIIDKGSFSDVVGSIDMENILHAGIVGALSGAVMGGGYRIAGAAKTADVRKQLGNMGYTQYSVMQNELSSVKTSELQKIQAELTKKGIDLTEAQLQQLARGEELTDVTEANKYIEKIQKAAQKDAKNEQTAMKAAGALIKIYNQLGDEKFAKAMSEWLTTQSNKANAINELKTVDQATLEIKDARTKEIVQRFNAANVDNGMGFKVQTEALSDNQRSLQQLMAKYGIDVVYGTVINSDGTSTREVYDMVTTDKHAVVVDSSLFNRYSQEYIVNKIVSEELAHTLQLDAKGLLSKTNLAKVQNAIKTFSNELLENVDMSGYENLDPNSAEYAAEVQAKAMIPLFMHDRTTIAMTFNVDKNMFVGLARFFRKKKREMKPGSDLYTQLKYRMISETVNLYDRVIIEESDNVSQAATLAHKTGRDLTAEDLKEAMRLNEEKWLKTDIAIPVDKSTFQILKSTFYNKFTANINEANVTRLKEMAKRGDFQSLNLELLNPSNYSESFISQFPGKDYTTEINDFLMDNFKVTIHPISGALLYTDGIFKNTSVERAFDILTAKKECKLRELVSPAVLATVDDVQKFGDITVKLVAYKSQTLDGEWVDAENTIYYNNKMAKPSLRPAMVKSFVHEIIHAICSYNLSNALASYNSFDYATNIATQELSIFKSEKNNAIKETAKQVYNFSKNVLELCKQHPEIFDDILKNEKATPAEKIEYQELKKSIIEQNEDLEYFEKHTLSLSPEEKGLRFVQSEAVGVVHNIVYRYDGQENLANQFEKIENGFRTMYTTDSKTGKQSILIQGFGVFKDCSMSVEIQDTVKQTTLAHKTSDKYTENLVKTDITSDLLLEYYDNLNLNTLKRAVNEAPDGSVGKGDTNEVVYKLINPKTQITSPNDIDNVKELIPFVTEYSKEFGKAKHTIREWQDIWFNSMQLAYKPESDLSADEKRLVNVSNRYSEKMDDYETNLYSVKNDYIKTAIINTIETGSTSEYATLNKNIYGEGVGKAEAASTADFDKVVNVVSEDGMAKPGDVNQTDLESYNYLDVPKKMFDDIHNSSVERREALFKQLTDKTNAKGMKKLKELMTKYGAKGVSQILQALSPEKFNALEIVADETSNKKQAAEQKRTDVSELHNQALKQTQNYSDRITKLFDGKMSEAEAKTLYNAIRKGGSESLKAAIEQSGKTKAEIQAELKKYYTPPKKSKAIEKVVANVEANATEAKIDKVTEETATNVESTETKIDEATEEIAKEAKIEKVTKEIAKGVESPEITKELEKVPEATIDAVNEVMPEPTPENIGRVNVTINENVVETPVSKDNLLNNLDTVLDESRYTKEAKDKVQFSSDDKTHKVSSMEVLSDINPVFKSQLDGNCDNDTVLLPLVDELIKISKSGTGFRARMADVLLGYIIGDGSFTQASVIKAVDYFKTKVSEAGHTEYVASTAVKTAQARYQPVTTMVEDVSADANIDVYEFKETVYTSEDVIDSLGVSFENGQGLNVDTVDRQEFKESKKLSKKEIAEKCDEVVKKNEERVNTLEKDLGKAQSSIEARQIKEEIDLRKNQNEALKKGDVESALDIEYRLADWNGKLKIEKDIEAATVVRYLKDHPKYKLSDLKDKNKRADVLIQMAEKMRGWRYFAMLSSPTTWIKNIAVNLNVKAMDRATMAVTSLLSKFIADDAQGYSYGKIVKISDGVNDYFKANFVENGLMNYVFHHSNSDMNKYAEGSWGLEDVRKSAKRRAEYAARAERQFGDSRLGKAFNKYAKIIDTMLNTGDAKFVQADFQVYLKNMLELNLEKIYNEIKFDPKLKDKIPDMTPAEMHETANTIKILENIPQDTLDIFIGKAVDICARTYFKNDNSLTKAIQLAASKNVGIKIFWALSEPFMRVGTNAFNAVLDYSPIGFLKYAGAKLVDSGFINKELSNYEKAFRKADETRMIAKASTGTAFMALGAILAALGWIDYDEDDYYGAVLKFGDLKIKLSDLAPALTPITLGASLAYAGKHDKGVLESFYENLSESTMLSNWDNAFEYNDNVGDYMSSLVSNYVTSYVPSVLKSMAKWFDNKQTKKSSNVFIKTFQSVVDGIPFVSAALPKKLDQYTGDFKRRYNVPFIGAFINTFSPVKIKLDSSNTLKDAYQSVNRSLSTPKMEFSDNGKTYKLNSEQYKFYVTTRATYAQSLVAKLITTEKYKSMSKDDKKKALAKVATKASNYAKKQYFRIYGKD